ncbi:hypothetical protein HPB50_012767 [Hyalomma asiaticum]|uniref:Uncharacterized protein n=1 Tax=Hyalomma asiaticum TaxID=266040 RepID=A0ACB7TJJ9_HYAAI|nr:hypothetical protein HPB50_012767 [Hyalomma asiaticum]
MTRCRHHYAVCIGRIASSDYGQFLRALQAAQQNLSKESKLAHDGDIIVCTDELVECQSIDSTRELCQLAPNFGGSTCDVFVLSSNWVSSPGMRKPAGLKQFGLSPS